MEDLSLESLPEDILFEVIRRVKGIDLLMLMRASPVARRLACSNRDRCLGRLDICYEPTWSTDPAKAITIIEQSSFCADEDEMALVFRVPLFPPALMRAPTTDQPPGVRGVYDFCRWLEARCNSFATVSLLIEDAYTRIGEYPRYADFDYDKMEHVYHALRGLLEDPGPLRGFQGSFNLFLPLIGSDFYDRHIFEGPLASIQLERWLKDHLCRADVTLFVGTLDDDRDAESEPSRDMWKAIAELAASVNLKRLMIQRLVGDVHAMTKALLSLPSLETLVCVEPVGISLFSSPFTLSLPDSGSLPPRLRTFGFSGDTIKPFDFGTHLSRFTQLRELAIGGIVPSCLPQLAALSALTNLTSLHLELVDLIPVADDTNTWYHVHLPGAPDSIVLPLLERLDVTLQSLRGPPLLVENAKGHSLPIRTSFLKVFHGCKKLSSFGLVIDDPERSDDDDSTGVLALSMQIPAEGSCVRVDLRDLAGLTSVESICICALNDNAHLFQFHFGFTNALARLRELKVLRVWGGLYSFIALPSGLLLEAARASGLAAAATASTRILDDAEDAEFALFQPVRHNPVFELGRGKGYPIFPATMHNFCDLTPSILDHRNVGFKRH